MDITPDTKLRDLLNAYPGLLEYLASYRPAFEKLRNPVLRSTVGAVATMRTAAEMGHVPLETFLADVRAAAGRLGGEDGEVGGERREETLKGIIRDLHEGAALEDVKARFDALVGEVGPDGIASVEQSLIAEGVPVEEIQRLCDVHVQVFKESLERRAEAEEPPSWPSGHPLETFERENVRAVEITSSIGCALESLPQDVAMRSIRQDLSELSAIDRHYLRKEHQLFPLLERHGISGPTKVMWSIHDEIRDGLKAAAAAAERQDAATLAEALPPLLRMIDDMVYKERKILFPLAAETLSEDEWREIASGEREIGFAWVEPGAEWAGARAALAEGAAVGGVPLTTGLLSVAQLDVMLRHVPFDITFVDEQDRVRFYSEGHRVFPRSPAVIGRRVVDCHPPKSVDVVERIIASFRDGSQDVAEFWIELEGRFVHIRYFALRDPDGAYAGTLEVVQDATDLRNLTGERRLLDW